MTTEKTLKAFLVWKGVSFEKVLGTKWRGEAAFHSLTYLLDLCEVQEPFFTSLRDKAEALMPYAVEVRYPGEAMEIAQGEAQEALATAEAVWNFILNLIPGGTHCLR